MMHTMTGYRDPVGAGAAPTFDEYADAVWPALYRYAYLLAGNHADAEDLAVAFTDFVRSSTGQRILGDAGFLAP